MVESSATVLRETAPRRGHRFREWCFKFIPRFLIITVIYLLLDLTLNDIRAAKVSIKGYTLFAAADIIYFGSAFVALWDLFRVAKPAEDQGNEVVSMWIGAGINFGIFLVGVVLSLLVVSGIELPEWLEDLAFSLSKSMFICIVFLSGMAAMMANKVNNVTYGRALVNVPQGDHHG